MKKVILASILSFLLLPMFASAALNTNLYYGLQKNSDVRQLQEFLISKGDLKGSATGNFFSLTLNGVQAYQASVGITPTGYVGTLTRASINKELEAGLSDSNNESVNETGNPLPTPPNPATNDDIVASIKAQILVLQQQLQALSSQQTTIQQIQQNTQQIAQNTTPTPTPAPAPEPTPAPVPVVASVPATATILLNGAFTNQVIGSNYSNARIGSFVIQNDSNSQSFNLAQLTVALQPGSQTSLKNFSALKAVFGSGASTSVVTPLASNTFSVNETLAPAQSETIDIFANSGPNSNINATMQTTLTVSGVSVVGQLITFK